MRLSNKVVEREDRIWKFKREKPPGKRGRTFLRAQGGLNFSFFSRQLRSSGETVDIIKRDKETRFEEFSIDIM